MIETNCSMVHCVLNPLISLVRPKWFSTGVSLSFLPPNLKSNSLWLRPNKHKTGKSRNKIQHQLMDTYVPFLSHLNKMPLYCDCLGIILLACCYFNRWISIFCIGKGTLNSCFIDTFPRYIIIVLYGDSPTSETKGNKLCIILLWYK